MKRLTTVLGIVLAALLLVPAWAAAFQGEGTLRIGGMWALSGGAAFLDRKSVV